MSKTADAVLRKLQTCMRNSEFIPTVIALLSVTLIISFRVFQHANDPLWTDDIVGYFVVSTENYGTLLNAVYDGIDSTPPLYSTICWIVAHILWGFIDVVSIIRLVNLCFTALTLCVNYAIVRSFASVKVSILSIFAYAAMFSTQIVSNGLDLRTYSLFVCSTSCAVLASLKYMSKSAWSNSLCLTLSLLCLTFSHTLAICTTLIIAGALSLALVSCHKTAEATRVMVAVAASVLLFAFWVPVIKHQSLLGSWIERPDLHQLLTALGIGTRPGLLASLIILTPLIALGPFWRGLFSSGDQTRIFLSLFIFGYLLFVTFMWIFSKEILPLFVPRYFSALTIAYFVLIALSVNRLAKLLERVSIATVVGLSIVALLSSMGVARFVRPVPPCLRADNTKFEEGAAGSLLTADFHFWMSRLDGRRQDGFLLVQGSDKLTSKDKFEQNYARAFARTLLAAKTLPLEEFGDDVDHVVLVDDNDKSVSELISADRGQGERVVAESGACRLTQTRLSVDSGRNQEEHNRDMVISYP